MKKILWITSVSTAMLFAMTHKEPTQMPKKEIAIKSEPTQQSQGESVVWYERGVAKTAVVDSSMVAEFDRGETLELQTKAVRLKDLSTPSVTVWQVESGSSLTAIKTAKSINTKGVYSPVLRDINGQLRALPGGVIVRLNPDLTPEAAGQWFAERNMTVTRRLEIGKNTFVIASESGMASLELANSLQGVDGVVWAQPEWWQKRVKK